MAIGCQCGVGGRDDRRRGWLKSIGCQCGVGGICLKTIGCQCGVGLG